MGLIDLHRILRAFGLGKRFEGDHPGVRPGESFVMRPSRWSGSVGGCVWLVLCVMLMSSWEDGFADTGDLASDHHGGIGHPRSVVSRCDAEALGGAKTEVRGLVTKLYSMVKEENIPNKILNIHSLLAMQDRPSSEAMSEYLYKRNERALRRSDEEEIGGDVQVVEVRGGWRVENELAKTQVDAVNTDVMNTESVRPWSVESVEGEVLCVSYSVLGIYFGRRR